MNVKTGTQTWSNSPKVENFKSDGVQNVSASDRERYFQDEAVGDTLNKVADPNWIDSSKKLRTVGNNELGKDAFMTLLLTQMKHQDPTNPLKSHEMAAQLAQFTSLEKLTNIDSSINSLRKDNEPTHSFQALALIGKTITMDNSKISRGNVDERHPLTFNLPRDATKGTIEIKDAAGVVIRKLEGKNLKAGRNEFNWNGDMDDGGRAPIGDYTMSVTALGSNGHKVFVETKAEGVITGVNFTAKGPQLLMGNHVLNMSDVKTITDQSINPQVPETLGTPGPVPSGVPQPAQTGGEQPAMISRPTNQQVEVKPETKTESKADQAKRARLAKGSLNDSKMTQGLINALTKEGAKAGMGS